MFWLVTRALNSPRLWTVSGQRKFKLDFYGGPLSSLIWLIVNSRTFNMHQLSAYEPSRHTEDILWGESSVTFISILHHLSRHEIGERINKRCWGVHRPAEWKQRSVWNSERRFRVSTKKIKFLPTALGIKSANTGTRSGLREFIEESVSCLSIHVRLKSVPLSDVWLEDKGRVSKLNHQEFR